MRTVECLLFASSLILAAALLFAPAASARPQKPRGGNAATGKTLYSSKMCNQCHGAAAQGTNAAPAIAGYKLSLTDFVHQVRTPASQMPAFDPQSVSDAQLADIYAFLRSAATPRR